MLKIEITTAQQTYLQNVTPEFYRTTKNLFVVNDKANKNNTEILSMAKEFFSNAKTPDEKLSNEVGFGVGGTLGKKAVNRINSKYSSKEISIKNDIIGKTRVGSASYKMDKYHNFNDIIDNYAGFAQKFKLKNATLYQLEGTFQGEFGRFEWIVQDGNVTRRMFIKGGKVTGIPIKP